MRIPLFIGAVLVLAFVMACPLTRADREAEENLTFTTYDEFVLHVYINYTGDEAQSERDYIDRWYDEDNYYGDDEVTEDEVEERCNDLEDSMDGNPYEYTLNDETLEVDKITVTLSNAEGDTDSTSRMTYHYAIQLSAGNMEVSNNEYVLQRATEYQEVGICVCLPSGVNVTCSYGLDDISIFKNIVRGTLDEDLSFSIVFTDDLDGDGYKNPVDRFPQDPKEWNDSDGDGIGDNADKFPQNKTEWADMDGDGHGDNSDNFKADPKEWTDTDGDDVGDNSDKFPLDPAASVDSDLDGYPDSWNDGYTGSETTLKIDRQPQNPKAHDPEVSPLDAVMSQLAIIGGIAASLLFLILLLAIVILVVMTGKYRKLRHDGAGGPHAQPGPAQDPGTQGARPQDTGQYQQGYQKQSEQSPRQYPQGGGWQDRRQSSHDQYPQTYPQYDRYPQDKTLSQQEYLPPERGRGGY